MSKTFKLGMFPCSKIFFFQLLEKSESRGDQQEAKGGSSLGNPSINNSTKNNRKSNLSSASTYLKNSRNSNISNTSTNPKNSRNNSNISYNSRASSNVKESITNMSDTNKSPDRLQVNRWVFVSPTDNFILKPSPIGRP